MSAAGCDRLVQFRRATMVDDGRQRVEKWADHGVPLLASKADISDGERWRAAAVQSQITARFVVRWSSFMAELTPKDAIVCEGTTYNITGIKEKGGRRRWLEIAAAARSDG